MESVQVRVGSFYFGEREFRTFTAKDFNKMLGTKKGEEIAKVLAELSAAKLWLKPALPESASKLRAALGAVGVQTTKVTDLSVSQIESKFKQASSELQKRLDLGAAYLSEVLGFSPNSISSQLSHQINNRLTDLKYDLCPYPEKSLARLFADNHELDQRLNAAIYARRGWLSFGKKDFWTDKGWRRFRGVVQCVIEHKFWDWREKLPYRHVITLTENLWYTVFFELAFEAVDQPAEAAKFRRLQECFLQDGNFLVGTLKDGSFLRLVA